MGEEKLMAAYHEAGHAVMDHVLRHGLGTGTSLSIIGEEDSEGRVTYPNSFSLQKFYDRFPKASDKTTLRYQAETTIMVAMAGDVAVNKRFGLEFFKYQDQEEGLVVRLANTLTIDSRETDAYLRWLRIRTESLLNIYKNWVAVKTLAKVLCRNMTVSSWDAGMIITESMRGWRRRRKRK